MIMIQFSEWLDLVNKSGLTSWFTKSSLGCTYVCYINSAYKLYNKNIWLTLVKREAILGISFFITCPHLSFPKDIIMIHELLSLFKKLDEIKMKTRVVGIALDIRFLQISFIVARSNFTINLIFKIQMSSTLHFLIV